jgi:hypothetical protein
VLLKGPATAAELPATWRAVVTALFGLGIAASLSGFWWALRASAGEPTTVRFDDLRRRYGSIRLYRLDVAHRAARDLGRARIAALVAVTLLASAVLIWWWAPPRNLGPTVIVANGAIQSCGTIVESDQSFIPFVTGGLGGFGRTSTPESRTGGEPSTAS